jgi:histidinol-phosphate aminotransferase
VSNNRFQHLAPAHIQQLVAYDPGYEPSEIRAQLGLPEVIELGSNESSFGPAAAVKQLLQNPTLDGFRYPDASGGVLKRALSQRFHLSPQHFTLGNGTHELLTLIAETFCAAGDEVVHAQYGFAVYRLAALGAGATPIAAPATPALNVTADALLAKISSKTKILYLANPNNPTGTLWTQADIRQLLLELPRHVLFVLDEAYVEYIDAFESDASLSLLDSFPNLIIARTFSKIHGLASLRVGYTIAHPEFAQMLERTRLSFNVNVLALKAAALAIADQAHVAWVKAQVRTQRQAVVDALENMGLRVLPSQCNFVLVHFGSQASVIEQRLLQQGVIVRPVRAYQLPEYLRITIGNAHENSMMLAALKNALFNA